MPCCPATSTSALWSVCLVQPRCLCVLNAQSVLSAGHTAAWVVYCVSQAPKVEAKIVEELRALDLLATPAQPVPRPIQWEDVAKLTYLNNVIKVRVCMELHAQQVGTAASACSGCCFGPPAHDSSGCRHFGW